MVRIPPKSKRMDVLLPKRRRRNPNKRGWYFALDPLAVPDFGGKTRLGKSSWRNLRPEPIPTRGFKSENRWVWIRRTRIHLQRRKAVLLCGKTERWRTQSSWWYVGGRLCFVLYLLLGLTVWVEGDGKLHFWEADRPAYVLPRPLTND